MLSPFKRARSFAAFIFSPLQKSVHVACYTAQEALLFDIVKLSISKAAISAQKFGKMPMVCTGRRDSPWSQPSSDAVGQYCTGEGGHEVFLCSGKKAEQTNSPLEGLS